MGWTRGRDVRHDIIPVTLHDHVARSKQLTTTALAQASSDRSSPAPRAEPGSRLGGSLLNGRSIVVYRSTVDIRDDILNVQPTRGTRPRMRRPRTRLRKPTTPTRGTLFPHGGHATPGGAERRALRMSSRTQHRPSTSNRACLTRFDGVTDVPFLVTRLRPDVTRDRTPRTCV